MNGLGRARKKAGLTQKEASAISGIPLSTLRRWEQGVNEPDIESIVKLADIYECTTDLLLGSKFANSTVSYSLNNIDDRLSAIVSNYNSMNDEGRERLSEYAEYIHTKFQTLYDSLVTVDEDETK